MYNNINKREFYAGMRLPISNVNINGTGYMLDERAKWIGFTSTVVISTANPYLNGSGTITDLITGSASGTLIKSITIKAQGSTTQGMIRIYFDDGTTRIMYEVPVPAITQSSEDQTFIHVIKDNFPLKYSRKLRVSTEKAETFVITAEGVYHSYPA
ncbi:MAG: hypothetical protein KJ607_04925 [Bacteroidetes bacterium]|nr:hypothetical protein [Bacteroidota bacterium]